MTNIKLLLAGNMKRLRNSLELSQAKLAEKVNSAGNYIAMIETGKRFPSPKMLERIAKALEVDTPELFSTEPAKKRHIDVVKGQILADIEAILAKNLGEM